MADTPRTLASLADGESAVVTAVDADPGTRLRLLELGLLPGTTVRVTRRAPMGDPIELRVRDFALSIRREEALGVRVEARS